MKDFFIRNAYGGLVNLRCLESLYIEEGGCFYIIGDSPAYNGECTHYVLYKTDKHKDAEQKFNDLIDILEANNCKVINLNI